MHTQVQCTYLRPSLKGTVWINPKKTAGRGLSQIGALSHSHINWQSLYSFKASASFLCFVSGRELGALWNLLLPLDCTKWLVWIGSVCFRASNKLEKFCFQGQTAASKKLRNVRFTPENHHERCSSEGSKCLLLLFRRQIEFHTRTHRHMLDIEMSTCCPLLCLDFSPPASPLSALYPSFHAEGDSFGELEPVSAWDWSMAWMEEMEAQYSEHYPGRNTRPFNS